MKNISLFSSTYLSAGLLAVALLFSQCGGSSDYKENEGSEKSANYNEDSAMYPDEKVQNNTNLTDDQPLEMNGDGYENLDKKTLLATLNRQKTMLEDRMEAMENAPQDPADSIGNMQQLQTYKKKLDEEITKVRNASDAQLREATTTAQAAIKGAGAVMQTNRLLLDRGF